MYDEPSTAFNQCPIYLSSQLTEDYDCYIIFLHRLLMVHPEPLMNRSSFEVQSRSPTLVPTRQAILARLERYTPPGYITDCLIPTAQRYYSKTAKLLVSAVIRGVMILVG